MALTIEREKEIGQVVHRFKARNAVSLAALTVLGGALAFCYVHYLNPVPDYYPEQQNDPFTYLILAKSIAAGNGYPTKHWMPGFPVLLSGWLAIFGQDFLYLKLCMVGMGLILLVACYFYYQAFLTRTEATWLCLLVAAAPTVFSYSHKLMSEIPCTTFIMLALALTELLTKRLTILPERRPILLTVVLFLVCAAAVLVRGNALALVPAVLAASITQPIFACVAGRRFKWPLLMGASGAVLAFCFWSVRNHFEQFSGIDNITYLQEVQAVKMGGLQSAGGFAPGVEKVNATQLAARIENNIVWYHTYYVADGLFPGAGALRDIKTPFLGFGIAMLLGAPAVIGLVPLLRLSVAGCLYLLFSLLLVIVYPFGGAQRMLIPSLPLLIVSAYLGLRSLFGTQLSRAWVVAAVCLGVVNCTICGRAQADHPYSSDSFGDFVAVLEYANQHYPGDTTALVSHRLDAVQALTECNALSLASATDDLRRARLGSFLLVEFEDFPPMWTPPEDVTRSLLYERGSARLWTIAAKPR